VRPTAYAADSAMVRACTVRPPGGCFESMAVAGSDWPPPSPEGTSPRRRSSVLDMSNFAILDMPNFSCQVSKFFL
jgi:hypothetical protein